MTHQLFMHFSGKYLLLIAYRWSERADLKTSLFWVCFLAFVFVFLIKGLCFSSPSRCLLDHCCCCVAGGCRSRWPSQASQEQKDRRQRVGRSSPNLWSPPCSFRNASGQAGTDPWAGMLHSTAIQGACGKRFPPRQSCSSSTQYKRILMSLCSEVPAPASTALWHRRSGSLILAAEKAALSIIFSHPNTLMVTEICAFLYVLF